MTVMQFAAECNRHIEAGHEFLAYWHPQGFMLLRQGVIEQEHYKIKIGGVPNDPEAVQIADTPEQRDAVIKSARRRGLAVWEVKPYTTKKKVKAGAAAKMRKIIGQLRKSVGTLYTVEYVDGVLVKEGVNLDVLQAIRIPGSGD